MRPAKTSHRRIIKFRKYRGIELRGNKIAPSSLSSCETDPIRLWRSHTGRREKLWLHFVPFFSDLSCLSRWRLPTSFVDFFTFFFFSNSNNSNGEGDVNIIYMDSRKPFGYFFTSHELCMLHISDVFKFYWRCYGTRLEVTSAYFTGAVEINMQTSFNCPVC